MTFSIPSVKPGDAISAAHINAIAKASGLTISSGQGSGLAVSRTQAGMQLAAFSGARIRLAEATEDWEWDWEHHFGSGKVKYLNWNADDETYKASGEEFEAYAVELTCVLKGDRLRLVFNEQSGHWELLGSPMPTLVWCLLDDVMEAPADIFDTPRSAPATRLTIDYVEADGRLMLEADESSSGEESSSSSGDRGASVTVWNYDPSMIDIEKDVLVVCDRQWGRLVAQHWVSCNGSASSSGSSQSGGSASESEGEPE